MHWHETELYQSNIKIQWLSRHTGNPLFWKADEIKELQALNLLLFLILSNYGSTLCVGLMYAVHSRNTNITGSMKLYNTT